MKKNNKDRVQFLLLEKQEWEEYIIKVYVNGNPVPERHYYTDDYDDAIETKEAMKAEAEKNGEHVIP